MHSILHIFLKINKKKHNRKDNYHKAQFQSSTALYKVIIITQIIQILYLPWSTTM